MADWLIRQINNPQLFKFILDNGWPLRFSFKEKIRNTLADISQRKIRNNNGEFEIIKADYPDAIPSDFMHLYWNLLINDQIYIQSFTDHKLWIWQIDFENYGLIPNLNLRKIISPKIILTGLRYFHGIGLSNNPESWRIKFDNLSFGIDDTFIQTIAKQNQPLNYYLTLLQEFIIALKSGLNLLQLFKQDIENLYDNESLMALKSIKPDF